MKQTKITALQGIGAASLLIIFAVLCLSVFALLTIATVQADERLGDHAEAAILDYYRADCEAEEILAQLRCGRIPEGVTVKDGIYSYTCTISETQLLAVSVTVSEKNYEILRGQAVSTTDWKPEDALPVWTGK